MNINAIGQGRPQMNSSISQSGEEDFIQIKQTSQEKPIIQEKKDELTKDNIDKALEKLNTFLRDEDTHAVYEVHDKLKDVMIKIVNNKTNEVVLEIPPKKILDLVAKMCEMVGILVDETA
ncbi:flagellar protein FlaG [Clostridium amylolyticum]|uniref:Flagellar protein FlaG n=2 Tax=Clostridium amylolyticum TaxID=1121298 RepID=A0A1M6CD34_9CLOT|nr:flagellar protein FlaG [Clostridium amylolyticum]